ncbi:MAG: hypothetical protein ACRDS1_02460 [Pseudonocardiaceae bacterium]
MNYGDVYHEIQQGTAGDRLPKQVIRVMTAIAEGTRPVAAVAHPLGFICLPVVRRGDYGVCVHVWTGQPPAEPTLTTSQIHSHSWELLSYVLYGEVHNQLVQVTDAPVSPRYRVFEVHSDGDCDEIRYTTRLVCCAPGAVQAIAAGGSYQLAAGEFHMTAVVAQAATVVLGRSRPGVVDLSLGDLDTPTHRIPRQRCAPHETACLARALADRMSESSRRSG